MSGSHRDTLRQSGARFVMVEHDIFDECRIKPTTLAVYCGLMAYANEEGYCFPSRGKLAERVGVSVSTVRTAIADLEEMALLQRFPRFNDVGEQMSNEYLIYRPSDPDRPVPAPAPKDDEAGEGYVTITHRGAKFNPPGGQNLPTPRLKSAHLNKNQLTRTNSEQEDAVSETDTRATITPSPEATDDRKPEAEPGPEAERPYDLVERVTQAQGADMSIWPKQQLGRQLAVAKRLLGDGVTIQEAVECTGWLASQSWVRSVDMFMVEKKIGEFRMVRTRNSQPGPGTGLAKQGMTAEEFFGDYYAGEDE